MSLVFSFEEKTAQPDSETVIHTRVDTAEWNI